MARISPQTQKNVIEYAKFVLMEHGENSDYHDKMEAIDIAYARYKLNKDPKTGVVHGEGIDAATTPAGVFNVPSTTPPVVVAQVDSMVGYLSEVFLSGTPLFPIVSNPTNKQSAESLEALLDDHSILGGYPRELLIFLRDSIKYNLGAVECDWTSVDQYDVLDEIAQDEIRKLKRKAVHYTKLRRLDLYNTVWDKNTNPGDIAKEGDYAGYISILSRPKLKRLLNKISIEGDALNVDKALESYINADAPNYVMHPQVSDYIASRKPTTTIDWASFLGYGSQKQNRGVLGNYEVFKLYARVAPADLGIPGPMPNTPQIFKFTIVNGDTVVQVKRIISAYDHLPILFGQPFEDGLGYQTKSIAEGSIPIQQAAGTLFNIQFNASRRAVSDRALYDPNVIRPSDVNSPVPAPKIPVKTNQLNNRPISDSYYPIPFDSRGTENAIQNGMQIVNFGKELSGLNNPLQGQFQKGNKSVIEWRDTMGNADARLRLPALALEYQFFVPLKEILKFNIFQYGEDAVVSSQRTGQIMEAKVSEMRQKVLSFRVADGYTPKSKLASTEAIINLTQMISQSPILQQAYGMMLPNIVAHLAQLMGVRGMEEYNPQVQQAIESEENRNPAESATMGPVGDLARIMQENDLRQQELASREQGLQLRQQELRQ